MQIKLDMKILVFILVFYMTHQIKIYALLMIFACLHEVAHSVTGLILGFKINTLEIKPIGFSIMLNNPIEDYNKKIINGNILELKKIAIYIAGPATNIICAIIIYALNINQSIKEELIYLNLIIAFVNFLPIYPFDGGRIFKSMMSIVYGIKKSYVLTEKISTIIISIVLAAGSIVVLVVQNYGLLIMLVYLFYIHMRESRRIEKKIKLYELLNKID